MKLSILSVCLFAFAFSTQTFAVDFTVNLNTDEPDASAFDNVCDIDTATAGSQCTIRAAVEQANNLASNDRVLFSLPVSSTIRLVTANGGDIFIINAGTLEIVGTGFNNLTIDGGTGTNRIFSTNQAIVTIMGVTLTGGNGNSGGAISTNGGTLVLNSVHVTANSSPFEGGGVSFFNGVNHQILNSTFSANTASDRCGGFFNNGGTLTVTNSTISGNSANGVGGGFCFFMNTTLRNVTITGNSAGTNGGGIISFGGSLNLGNTIVAGNTAGNAPDINSSGNSVTTAGYNLIGINTSVEASFPAGVPNANNDIVGTSTSPVTPMLAALADNGGTNRIPTHELLTGSLAIDKGFSFGSTTDQRGLARPVDNISIPNATGGNGADIGAFEVQLGATAASVSVSGRVTARGRGISNAAVHLTSQSGEILTSRTNRLGYYTFTDLAAGETYIFNVFSKRYQFNPQVVNLTEDLAELDFSAQ